MVNKNGLLHGDDTQVSVCKKNLPEKKGKKVSYFNFVVFSRSARMPTTVIDVYALPHLIVLSINFQSSVIVCMYIFSFSLSLSFSFLFIVRLCILNRS
jgi:hypothetical protein